MAEVLRSSVDSIHFGGGQRARVVATSVTHELKQEQLELVSAPYSDQSALSAAIT